MASNMAFCERETRRIEQTTHPMLSSSEVSACKIRVSLAVFESDEDVVLGVFLRWTARAALLNPMAENRCP